MPLIQVQHNLWQIWKVYYTEHRYILVIELCLFLDSTAPSWENCMDGQVNLRDAILRKIEFKNPNGKIYKLNPNVATLLVRYTIWNSPYS